MKYLVVLCDGMADLPLEELSGKTPMQAAKKPTIDSLAKKSTIGICKTVADGLKPGSDVANLSVLGYNAKTCYSGRSPLEAANLGINLSDNQVALRCNLVTLSEAEKYEDRTMVDYCGGDISTAEADELVKALEAAFSNEHRHFYTGVQYRHCLVVDNGSLNLDLTPPHDISERVIGEHLSKVPQAQQFIDLMKKSVSVLENHPVNKRRVQEGKRPANSAWFWGEGKRPKLSNFKDMFGINGAVVSAVDLIRGIGRLAGMDVAQVSGATGYIDTNFDGKAAAAIEEFEKGNDFVFVHLEAPDECGHRGESKNKVRAIELIDEKIVAPLVKYLGEQGDFRLLVMPDHPTPISTRTHSSQPVPFMIYDRRKSQNGFDFTEENAQKTGVYIGDSRKLMPMFIGK